jgi:predicted dehydrogenase
MKQVVQDIRGGATRVAAIPDPLAVKGTLLIANVCSAISAGTEKYVVDLAQKSLIGKARQRPEQVRRVLQKMREEGILNTLTQVQAKLSEPMPLGYSSAGVVIECGAGVSDFKPGDRVANAGPHAGIVSVSRNLCARIPEGVSFEQASFTSIASIGLQGIRLANLELGSRVLVIGLGLIGQICVALLKAQGCKVFGTDIDPAKLDLARKLGADEVATGAPLSRVTAFSDGFGVDAVIITAATASNQPIEFAAAACRRKARIVLVGVVGLDLPRPPFFEKELEFTVSSSLGAGRGDYGYEEKGIDYPIGYARWTAQRNMVAVLDMIREQKLPIESLISHRFPIDRADEAYTLISNGREPFLGIVLEYPDAAPERTIALPQAAPPETGSVGVSVIGSGNFSRLVLMPEIRKSPGTAFRGLCSARGLTAEASARQMGFSFATTDPAAIWTDDATNAVCVVTRHDLHADLVVEALRHGKKVMVEKPLAITFEELERVRAQVEGSERSPFVFVGFNRRFAPATEKVRGFFSNISPIVVTFRFSVPTLPVDHWTHDEEVGGGRLIGEACHAIDTCVAITGSEVAEVFAASVDASGRAGSADRASITLRHRNGSLSNIVYVAGGDRSAPSERIEVFGGERTATIDAWNTIELWSGGKVQKSAGSKDRGHHGEISTFLHHCRTGSWPVPWRELYNVSLATLLVLKSLREGLPQRVDDHQENPH